MLVIRLQRTGRKGYAMYRLVVQDSRRTPTSGKVIAYLGSYDPHAKTVVVDKEKAEFYLHHGAQPTARAVSLLKENKVKLPVWVAVAAPQNRSVRNPEKRRSTAPTKVEPAPVSDLPKEAEPLTEPETVEAETAKAEE